MASDAGTPIHPRRGNGGKSESSGRFLARQVMNLTFILGVVALIVLYFVKPQITGDIRYIIFGMFVVLVKIAEMIIRYLPR